MFKMAIFGLFGDHIGPIGIQCLDVLDQCVEPPPVQFGLDQVDEVEPLALAVHHLAVQHVVLF